ncbi:DNA repair protein RecO [Marasmitruncus massiliensis]|uniref:DNA repair protein RecO n=1 Tax=Marasmitruncus massiliensis TaxID=1944642 RepID=UPI000C7BD5A8|nr:DNA repair protein RecO [Marasmitruncus massiliensis]
MHITTDAIVLREQSVDEFDSVLTLLTRDCGIISAYARGARKPRGTMRVSVELLSYSCFVLFCNKDKYTVDKADLNHVFMGVRADVERLSLAAYFCQLAAELAPREEEAQDYLRLLLNSLYLLDQNKRTCTFIKPVFELRLMAMAGYMPDLVACAGCGCYEAGQMFFMPLSSGILCGSCAANLPDNERRIPVSIGVLAAMRHILYAEQEKLFQFSLPQPALERLGEITQQYIMVQLDKRFDTLDFYFSIRKS